MNGHEPAEALHQDDRRRVVLRLHGRGWTDEEIAVRTRMTPTTAARIRNDLGLAANQGKRESEAVPA
jgi:hypothetical protein